MLTARLERSIALAKDVAQKLEVDLFDDRRRGRFRDIVQNCITCAYQTECMRQVTTLDALDRPLPNCRNKDFFSNGA